MGVATKSVAKTTLFCVVFYIGYNVKNVKYKMKLCTGVQFHSGMCFQYEEIVNIKKFIEKRHFRNAF